MDETQNQTPVADEGASSSKKKYIIIGIVVVLALLLAQSLFSPERAAERAFERATGGQYDIDSSKNGGSIKIKGEDGAEIEITSDGGGKLPKDWPSSVPLPNNAKIEYGGTMADGSGGKNLTVSFTTRDSASEVAEYYADKLSSSGWTIEANLTTGDGAMISAKKGEDVAVAYISAGDDETSVSLNVQVGE
jgi:hypothetical protein